MKRSLRITAGLLILAGAVFFMQGLNLLTGSFMSGDLTWARNGILMVLVGISILLWAHRE